MTIHTRDYADRAGAVIGTVGGVRLGYSFFAVGKVSELIIHGHSYGRSAFIKGMSLFLTMGLCANLGRNSAVGIHDSIYYSIILTKDLYKKIDSCFAKTFNSNQETIGDSPTRDNEVDKRF